MMAGYCDRCIKEGGNPAGSGLYWAGNERVCAEHLEDAYEELKRKLDAIRDESASIIYLKDSSDYLPALWSIFKMCGYDSDDLDRVAKAYLYLNTLEKTREKTVVDKLAKMMTVDNALKKVKDEIERAVKHHGAFNSPHEGYAVIKEEKDEFIEALSGKRIEESMDGIWSAVKLKKENPERVEKFLEEGVQFAAMIVRFIADFC